MSADAIIEVSANEPPTRPATADPVADYLAQLDAAETTVATYSRALRQWTGWLDGRGLSVLGVTRSDVLAYKDDLLARGLSPRTVNLYLSSVSGLYKWLASELVYPDVTAGVRPVRTGRGSRDALTREQTIQLLALDAGTTDERELRDRAITCLMVRRGLREVEITRANRGDLTQEEGVPVLWTRGKGYRGGRDDYVVLSEPILDDLYAYLAVRGDVADGDPLFVSVGPRNRGGRLTTGSVRRAVARRLDRCGLRGARLVPHSLRHTAVTLSLRGGATVQEAQDLARHADLSTTMRYAHNIDHLEGAGGYALDAYLDGARHS